MHEHTQYRRSLVAFAVMISVTFLCLFLCLYSMTLGFVSPDPHDRWIPFIVLGIPTAGSAYLASEKFGRLRYWRRELENIEAHRAQIEFDHKIIASTRFLSDTIH